MVGRIDTWTARLVGFVIGAAIVVAIMRYIIDV